VSEETSVNCSSSVLTSAPAINLALNRFLIQLNVALLHLRKVLKEEFQRIKVTSTTNYHIVTNSCLTSLNKVLQSMQHVYLCILYFTLPQLNLCNKQFCHCVAECYHHHAVKQYNHSAYQVHHFNMPMACE